MCNSHLPHQCHQNRRNHRMQSPRSHQYPELSLILRYLFIPVPAGISLPMITFSFIPMSGSTLPLMAASVRTFVVSWKDAADRKELVAREAFVIPSSTCLPSASSLPSFSRSSFVSSKSSVSTNVPGAYRNLRLSPHGLSAASGARSPRYAYR